jgi:heme a synthase
MDLLAIPDAGNIPNPRNAAGYLVMHHAVMEDLNTLPSTTVSQPPVYNRGLHTLALLTAIATFPLICMGGLVTSHHAGMSVPDWPNSYGYNMFLFPPRLWIGGIFYEHTHRLMGTVVGFLSILLALSAWGVAAKPGVRKSLIVAAAVCVLLTIVAVASAALGLGNENLRHLMPHFAVGFGSLALVFVAGLACRRREPRRWIRWLSLVVLIVVIIQGILGGMRVTKVNLTLAIIHGCFAQAFFGLAVFMVIVTSRWWMNAPDLSHSPDADQRRKIIALAITVTLIVYGQLIVGALMRHYQAGLAIPDLPFAYGKWLPPMNQAQLDDANHLRVWKLNLDPVTLGQIWLHYAHRLGAMIVTISEVLLITTIVTRHKNIPKLLWPGILLFVLLMSQLTLGLLTVYYRKPADVASAHVAVGALVLITTFMVAVRAIRLYSIRHFR